LIELAESAFEMAHILLYHAIDLPAEPVAFHDPADVSVVVDLTCFREQLQWINQTGKRVVSLEQAMLGDRGSPSCEDSVVLTFDDGHRSNWSLAFPALLEARMPATFYVVAGFVDTNPQYVTTAQLREMAAHGMWIGSHTMTHRWLPELTPAEIRRELADSKAKLEDLLQRPVLDFALPGGHYNRAIIDAVRECGYRSVATSKVGIAPVGSDPIRLPRIEIRRNLSMDGFRNRFRPNKLMQLRLIEAAKTCVRRTFGLSRYMRLRRLAHRCFGTGAK
jgi:peptidoglycan/xylan/chitin deacetylase (PgdA/CDA1 family)